MTTHLTIKKTTLAYALSVSLLAAPVMAKKNDIENDVYSIPPNKMTQAEYIEKKKIENKKNEGIGFGTGALIGAIVAGPFGAVVSSFIGAFTAKHINTVNDNEELTTEINSFSEKQMALVANYQEKIQELESNYKSELLALQKEQRNMGQLQAENLLMSLQFPSGSSEVQAHYHDQIVTLANLLKQSPNFFIDLSGYTDLQGSDELNHSLSIARVTEVKNSLVEQGIAAERINLYAFGEKSPIVASTEKEKSFYDRRVVIKLTAMNENENENSHTAKN